MKLKLAVKRDGGELQGLGGYHWFLFPMVLDDKQAAIYEHMGFIIIEVEETLCEQLLKDAAVALNHQLLLATLCHEVIK